ncbi:MAG: TIGR02757 family protein [Dissulfurispiraceae bacterium]
MEMTQSLKHKLDRFYSDYDFQGRIAHDPIELPHQYTRPEDIEISGFIASCFAYGKVTLFKPVVKALLSRMGPSPSDFLLHFNVSSQRDLFAGLRYRFNRNDDFIGLLYVLSRVLRKYGSLESAFKQHYRKSDSSVEGGLAGLIDIFLGLDMAAVYGNDMRREGLLQFFPSPSRGSACKRMNMFLRWMIRDRDIDFGIWKGIPKNKLVIPLDVHIARISRCLGFTRRSAQDWKTAVEITESLKTMDPEDPLKYDFALCHQGIAGVCSSMHCAECALFGKADNDVGKTGRT